MCTVCNMICAFEHVVHKSEYVWKAWYYHDFGQGLFCCWFVMLLKSCAHQDCIYSIKNTVKWKYGEILLSFKTTFIYL